MRVKGFKGLLKLFGRKKALAQSSSSMTAEEVIRIGLSLTGTLPAPKISTLVNDRFATLKKETDKMRVNKIRA